MAKAFYSDIWRCIKKGRKRFAAIAAITLLGVAMLTGLKAGCEDLSKSADDFFDSQGLFDVSVVSTLGMTDRDVRELSAVQGVEAAEGTYEENTYTQVGGVRKSVSVKSLSNQGFNEPQVVQGALPSKPGQIAVTSLYMEESGASLGDTLLLEAADEDSEIFERTEYVITGVIVDPSNINGSHAMAFRSGNAADYSFFAHRSAVTADVYTAVYVRVAGSAGLMCYSEEYEQLVGQVEARIEAVRTAGEQARTNEVVGEAQAELDDARAEAEEQFSDAEKEFSNAQEKLEDGRAELEDGRAKLEDGRSELASGWSQLEAQQAKAQDEFNRAQKQIDDGYAQIAAAEKDLEQKEASLDAAEKEADEGLAQAQAGVVQAQAGIDQIEEQIAQLQAAEPYMDPQEYQAAQAHLEGLRSEAEAGLAQAQAGVAQAQQGKEQIAAARAQIAAGWETLAQQRLSLEEGAQELARQKAAAESQFADARQQLLQGQAELDAAEAEFASGQEELEDGQAELDKQYDEYLGEKSDALEELASAQADIDAIEDAQWYVRNRASVGSYASIDSDTSSIETIGVSFSIIFLIVAILISLTTITRMVEEERGLIGTYKALGYRGKEIMTKYLLYAGGACAFGAVLGLFCGYVLLPEFLFMVFRYMYILPTLHLTFSPVYAAASAAVFIVGIVGAAFLACRAELAQSPAALMRPKAPRGGSRILLERIPFAWNRLSFLNKVTMRNLFRYKKRFFMTVAGIAGCTALLVCGFVIKDSVDALQPAQYGHVYDYDIMYVADEDDLADVTAWAKNRQETAELLEMRVDSVSVSKDGAEEDMQLMVLPRGASFEGYITLEDRNDAPVSMDEYGVAITQNASIILGFEEEQAVSVQTSDLKEAELQVGCIVRNYMGNFMVMTQEAYEEAFGPYEANAAFLNVKEGADSVALNQDLSQRSDVLSTACIAELSATFASAFYLITAVTVLLIGMAAALAFVVLFTLSTTNISERLRELATIKVLGFRQGEVHRYVNKETVILTFIGIAIGLPFGRWLGGLLTVVLEMPGVYFAVNLEPTSYLICAGFTLLFTVLVNLVTNRTLDRVNMVEALKSVE